MAFPTTSVLDTFNRANGPVGAAWTSPMWIGIGTIQIVSNAATFDTFNPTDAYWNASTFGPDCEVYATWSKVEDAARVAMYIRFSSPGAASSGYFVYINPTDNTRIYRNDAGVQTQLGADILVTFVTGDSVGVEASGTTLTLYKKTGGTWSVVDTRTDSTYTTGYTGLYGQGGTANTFDDFGGGTVVGPANYTVINGTQAQLANVNAGGTDVDAMSYKTTVSLTSAEAAALASTAGVLVTADATPQQIRLIVKNIVRFQSS